MQTLPPQTTKSLYEFLNHSLKPVCASSSQAKTEAELLLNEIFNLTKQAIICDDPIQISSIQWRQLNKFLEERIKERVPIQYLLGWVEFYGLRFSVNQSVLIPRPETELLVEEALTNLKNKLNPTVLDLGTGSGCIAIAIKKNVPASVTAIDCDQNALNMAKKNAQTHDCDIEWIQGDWLIPVQERTFDLIVSNPPYIGEWEKTTMTPEVLDHEPSTALFPSASNQDNKQTREQTYFYEQLATKGKNYLNPDGIILAELGTNLAKPVRTLFEENGFKQTIIKNDYAGLPRIIIAKR